MTLSGSGTNPDTYDNILDQFGNAFLILEPYTGNDISSVGDSIQYGRLKYITTNRSVEETTDYFPIYNGDFWNIFVGVNDVSSKAIGDTFTDAVKFGAYQSNF